MTCSYAIFLEFSFIIRLFSCFLVCIRHQGRAIAKDKLSSLTGTKREQYYEALQQLRNSDFSTSDFNLYGLLPEDDDDDDEDEKPERVVKKPKQTKEKTLKGVRRSKGMDKTQPRFPQPMLRRQYYHPNSYVSLCDEGAKRVFTSYPLLPYAMYTTTTLVLSVCVYSPLCHSRQSSSSTLTFFFSSPPSISNLFVPTTRLSVSMTHHHHQDLEKDNSMRWVVERSNQHIGNISSNLPIPSQ